MTDKTPNPNPNPNANPTTNDMRWALEGHITDILCEHLWSDYRVEQGIKDFMQRRFPGITPEQIESCVEAVLGDESGSEPNMDIVVSMMFS